MRTSPNSCRGGQYSAFSDPKSQSLLEIRQKKNGEKSLCCSVQRTAQKLIGTPFLLPAIRPVLQL
jgi:hypothetical protein